MVHVRVLIDDALGLIFTAAFKVHVELYCCKCFKAELILITFHCWVV